MGNVYCTDWVEFDLNKGGLQPYLSSDWWDYYDRKLKLQKVMCEASKNSCILVANQPHPFPLLLLYRISSR
jgi:hypothetical protein